MPPRFSGCAGCGRFVLTGIRILWYNTISRNDDFFRLRFSKEPLMKRVFCLILTAFLLFACAES